MSAGILQDKSVALNSKNDVPVVSQPTTRCGVRVYKIVILGDGGVGKSGNIIYIVIYLEKKNILYYMYITEMIFSAVTLQFVSHSFLDYHDPTIGKNLFHMLQ